MIISVKEADKFFLYIFINVAVTNEGAATFGVSAKRTYKIGIFDFLVKVADECTSGEIALVILSSPILDEVSLAESFSGTTRDQIA